MRVVIADDSAGIRLAISAAFRRLGAEVVGTATDGVDAVRKVLALKPDLVTLDLDMPGRDGVAAAAAIHRQCPETVMVLISGSSPDAVRKALAYAPQIPLELIPKPTSQEGFDRWADDSVAPLITRVNELRAKPVPKAIPVPAATPRLSPARFEAILVSASTGGPSAVTTFLSQLDVSIGIPVVIVQHMPAKFTEIFAKGLDAATAWQVREAYEGAVPRPGEAWVAQGDRHLKVERNGESLVLRMDDGEREHGCRPAVDVLYRSAATSLRGNCLCVMLTGMGRDGTPGAGPLHAAGATFVAQDQATSVVWGMPGALTQAGYPEAVLPLGEIAGWVNQRVWAINARAMRGVKR